MTEEPGVTCDPEVMGGVPCIRGTRIPVVTILGLVQSGEPSACQRR